MDFTHEDRADPQKLNVILWKDAMGDKPVPALLLEKRKKQKKMMTTRRDREYKRKQRLCWVDFEGEDGCCAVSVEAVVQ